MYSKGAELALITGAAGGVGLAVARTLGGTRKLILTDMNAARLTAARESLQADGVNVAGTVVGRLQDGDVLKQISLLIPEGRSLDVLVHCAGLSPMQTDWRNAVIGNAVATRHLLTIIGPRMAPSGAAVLLSSLAGHAPISVTQADAILDDWTHPELLDRLAPHIETLPDIERSGRAYMLAKRMILRLCEKLSVEWASRDVRIVSISPGVIDTPMGRLEAQENPSAANLLDQVPLGGYVTPNDIAAAATFLVSPAARFITGTDLKIDGGLYAGTMAGGT